MKYKISDNFEINIVEDRHIYISHDFSAVYSVDDIGSYIINCFETEKTIDEVYVPFSSMEDFNKEEFFEFIRIIIENKIIVPYLSN